ncbi:acetylornithine aminotransferase [Mycobacteroides abscessus subsp. massiliense]|nr:acetylornithine aminotransferase [Mycobacteroides abscessus subsp. massiliense]
MTEAPDSTSRAQQRWEHVMMNNYGTPPIVLAEGEGAVVTDVDGPQASLDLRDHPRFQLR